MSFPFSRLELHGGPVDVVVVEAHLRACGLVEAAEPLVRPPARPLLRRPVARARALLAFAGLALLRLASSKAGSTLGLWPTLRGADAAEHSRAARRRRAQRAAASSSEQQRAAASAASAGGSREQQRAAGSAASTSDSEHSARAREGKRRLQGAASERKGARLDKLCVREGARRGRAARKGVRPASGAGAGRRLAGRAGEQQAGHASPRLAGWSACRRL